jgi:hypothetical protein
MKRQILGWVVIFTVTLLLSACASHEAQANNYIKMSGADATMAQPEKQEHGLTNIDDTFTYSPTSESQPDQRDFDQVWSADAVFVSDAFLEESAAQTGQREVGLASSESFDDTFIFSVATPGDREQQLDQREIDLEWRENTVAVARVLLSEQEMQLNQREIDLEFREDSIAVSTAQLNERETLLVRQERYGIGTAQLAEFDSTPAGAEPGRCYARAAVPGEYLTVTDKVLINPAGTKVEVIPARYATVSKQVMVERGSIRVKTIPAEHKTVTERMMVEPASKYLVHVPAQYEVILEQVMTTPATTTWKKGTGPIQRVDKATGEILCLVETPAQYQTVSKRILKSPATTREVDNPPVYEMIERQELVTPAKTVRVDIPAKYKTVQVTKLVTPEYVRSTPTPARYQTVTKRVKVTEDSMEWNEILCATNLTHSKASNIQRALSHAGYSPGPIDGIIGGQTMEAVNDFQKANNLTVAKYLTVDTLEALGLEQ